MLKFVVSLLEGYALGGIIVDWEPALNVIARILQIPKVPCITEYATRWLPRTYWKQLRRMDGKDALRATEFLS